MLRRLLAVVVALASLGACARPADAPGPDSEEAYAASQLTPERTPEPRSQTLRERLDVHPHDSLVATAVSPRIRVFDEPGAKKPFAEFTHPGPYGTPRVFLVRRAHPKWVRVLVPMRPNGTQGWIRSRQVDLASNPYHLTVDLSDLELQVRRRQRVVFRHTVAIGTPQTPTPTGLFYTTILARPSDPDSPYGKYALGLSGYSEVLTTFAGGDGQIAIHGTNNPDSIGTPASHGCIRVDNPTVSRLAKMLPLGTPVRIRR